MIYFRTDVCHSQPQSKRIALADQVELSLILPPLPYPWIERVKNLEIENVLKTIKSEFSKDSSTITASTDRSFTNFFDITLESLHRIPFGYSRIFELFKIFEKKIYYGTPYRERELQLDNKIYIFSLYLSNQGTFAQATQRNNDLYEYQYNRLTLSLKQKKHKETPTIFMIGIYLNSFHGEWILINSDTTLRGSQCKNLAVKISRLFLTHATLKDRAYVDNMGMDVREPYHYPKTLLFGHKFILTNWLLFARETPHTFYNSAGFGVMDPSSENIDAIEDEPFVSTDPLRHSNELYCGAIKYAREIKNSDLVSSLIKSSDIVHFDKLVTLYSSYDKTFTELCQNVDRANNEYHKVYLNMLIGCLRPLKTDHENGLLWLALNIIKHERIYIAVAPFEAVSVKTDVDFATSIDAIQGRYKYPMDSIFTMYFSTRSPSPFLGKN